MTTISSRASEDCSYVGPQSSEHSQTPSSSPHPGRPEYSSQLYSPPGAGIVFRRIRLIMRRIDEDGMQNYILSHKARKAAWQKILLPGGTF